MFCSESVSYNDNSQCTIMTYLTVLAAKRRTSILWKATPAEFGLDDRGLISAELVNCVLAMNYSDEQSLQHEATTVVVIQIVTEYLLSGRCKPSNYPIL